MPERVVVASGSGIFTSGKDKTTDAGVAFSQGVQKNGAGTEIPFKIDGTRSDPHFGLDFGRRKTK